MKFVTPELNAITRLFPEQHPSEWIQHKLCLEYVNLEATLLRAKVLRNFSKARVVYIAQAQIVKNDNNLAYLFAPLIIANLNQSVIYTTSYSLSVFKILNQYYQSDRSIHLKIEEVIQSLNLYIDLVDQPRNEEDFLYRSLIKALCRTDVSEVFLITYLRIDEVQLCILQDYFEIKIHVIYADKQRSVVNDDLINTRKLLFKTKDEFHRNLCVLFSQLNTSLIAQTGQFNQQQAMHLIEDMFYSEHIFEKLSVYGEYMQTRIQNGANFKVLSTNELSHH
ncbi:hypothetical protein F2A31_06220 [Acinetobacter suaedae]|uniref:Uncharacterized protein n=1 Tax=Acinetobacter suaedae TaxID=2609668 RepID=A0A5P1UU28_9GAMM|nr:hypothetical protein [Acinetobacter sp. C16S1]QER39320.1 hypothetical protein F2A31_06220 [Acinetobacter sp. C16S1]